MTITALEHLRTEHRNISALLNILERQLDSISGNDKPDYHLMYEILHYLAFYPDQYHHPFEDLLVARLAQLRPDIQSILEEQASQHRAIAEKSAWLLDYLDRILADQVVPRQSLVRDGKLYVNEYRDHMQKEEQGIFEVLTENLSPADWLELTTAFHWKRDPLFSDRVSEEYRYLRDCITNEGAGAWPWEGVQNSNCPVCSGKYS